MGKKRAEGVIADQLGGDLHTDQAMPVDGKHRDVFLAERQLERNRLVGPPATKQAAAKALDLRLADAHQRAQLGDEGIQIGYPFANQSKAVNGPVVGQQHAVAIENQAAGRRQRFDTQTIALGEVGEMLILKDLQLDETSHEHGAQQHHPYGGDNDPTKKHALLAPRVLQR